MTNVSVRDLKNRLSEHLRRLEAGETITVTRRGKPVAVMTPAAQPPMTDIERRMWKLVDEGIVKWSGGKVEGLRPGVKLTGGPTAAEVVIQGRD